MQPICQNWAAVACVSSDSIFGLDEGHWNRAVIWRRTEAVTKESVKVMIVMIIGHRRIVTVIPAIVLFNNNMICVWYMYDMCMIYVWYMSDICMIYVWYMYDICMIYVWYRYDIFMVYNDKNSSWREQIETNMCRLPFIIIIPCPGRYSCAVQCRQLCLCWSMQTQTVWKKTKVSYDDHQLNMSILSWL